METFDLEEELLELKTKNNIPTNCYLRNALSSNKGPMLLGQRETTNGELKRGRRLLKNILFDKHLNQEDILLDNWKNSSAFFNNLFVFPNLMADLTKSLDDRFKMEDLMDTFNFHGTTYYKIAGFEYDPISLSKELERQVCIFLFFHRLVLDIRKTVLTSDIFERSTPMGPLVGASSWILVKPTFFLGKRGKQFHYLYPWDSFLAFVKILSSRINVLLFSELNQHRIPNLPTTGMLKENWHLWDSLITEKGELAVPLLKKYEPLCLSFLSVITPDLLDLERSFRESTFDTFKGLLLEVDCLDYWGPFYDFYSNLPTVEVVYELFGLFRTFAFPHVNSRDTIESIAEHGMKPHSWKVEDYILDQANIKMEFYRRYLNAYRTPPSVDLSLLSCTTYLYTCLRNGHMPNRHHQRYKHTDWGLISFQQCIDLEVSDSLSTYLSDKASSPKVSDWLQYITLGTKIPPEERRLLLKFLDSSDSSVKEVIEHYSETYDDEDLRIISIKVKESELKKKGRGFGIMTYKMRLLQVVREVLAKKLSKLFPEITITDDEITYRKRRFRSGKRTAFGGDSIRIRKMIDIEKFCSSQRYRESLAVYQSIDELLGTTDLFTRVHPVFSSTIIIDGERELDPDLEGLLDQIETLKQRSPGAEIRCFSDGAFIGMEGGIEGLCQYLWTINLIIRISKVFQDEEISFEIMIQGDNVNVFYDIPWRTSHLENLSHQELQELRDIDQRIGRNLSETLSKAGMSMNTEESLTSCVLSIYGKEAYNPNQLTLLSKRISVMPWITSETYIDVPTLLSSLTTALEAASEQCNFPDYVHQHGMIVAAISWFWLCQTQCWEGWNYPLEPLDTELTLRHYEQENKITRVPIRFGAQRSPLEIIIEDLFVASCVGSALGGLPFPHVLDLEKRGVGDYISHRLAICKKYIQDGEFTLEPALRQYVNLPINHRVDYNKLFESPYSLNLITEEDANAVLKRITSVFFKNFPIKNQRIAELRGIADEGLQQLDDEMSQTDSLHPRILHMVRELTLVKEAEKLTRKFSSARTLRDLSLKSGQGGDVGSQLRLKSLNKMCFHIWRKRRNPLLKMWSCSTVFAKALRDYSWKKDILGVTTPSPLEQFKFLRADDTMTMGNVVQETSVQYFEDNGHLPLDSLLTTRGPLTPFIGSTTSGQIFRPFYEVKGDPKAKKAASILSLLGTLIEFDSNLGKLIRHLGREILQVSTDNPSSYLALETVKSDSVLSDGIRKETMAFNGVINVLTHLSHKFWNFSELRGTRLNRSDILIHGYQSTIKELRIQQDRALGYFIKRDCEECSIPDNSQWANCGPVTLTDGMGYRIGQPEITFFQTLREQITSTSMFNFSSRQQLYYGLGMRDGRLKQQKKQGEVSKFRVIEGRYLDDMDPVCYSLGYVFGLMVTARESLLIEEFRVEPPTWSQTRRVLWRNATSNPIAFAQGLGFLIEDDYYMSVLAELNLLTYFPQSVPTTIADIGMSVIGLMANCLERLEIIGLTFFICILPSGLKDVDLERSLFFEALNMLRSHSDTIGNPLVFIIEDSIPDPSKFEDFNPFGRGETSDVNTIYQANFVGSVESTPLEEFSPPTGTDFLSLVSLKQIIECQEETKKESTKKINKGEWKTIDHMPMVGTLSFLRNACLTNMAIKEPDILVVVGGGLGGCCVPYLLKFPNCKLLFFTLRGESDRLSEDRGLIIPPAIHSHRLHDRIISSIPLLLSNGDMDNPMVYNAALTIIMNYLNVEHKSNVLLLNEIETPTLSRYPFQGIFVLIEVLKDRFNLQCMIKLPGTNSTVAEIFANKLGSYAKKASICVTSYHHGEGEGRYLFLPQWQKQRKLLRLSLSVKFPPLINMDTIEEYPSLRSTVRGSIPRYELEQMRESIMAQLIRMRIVLRVNNSMVPQLIHELQFGILRHTKWEHKAKQWSARGSTENQRIGITQEEIKNLILAAWLLRWVVEGVWMTDADEVEDTPVAIVPHSTERLELLPLGYGSSKTLETFRLSHTHPNRKLRTSMARLRGLAFILDCPSPQQVIVPSGCINDSTPIARRRPKKMSRKDKNTKK